MVPDFHGESRVAFKPVFLRKSKLRSPTTELLPSSPRRASRDVFVAPDSEETRVPQYLLTVKVHGARGLPEPLCTGAVIEIEVEGYVFSNSDLERILFNFYTSLY